MEEGQNPNTSLWAMAAAGTEAAVAKVSHEGPSTSSAPVSRTVLGPTRSPSPSSSLLHPGTVTPKVPGHRKWSDAEAQGQCRVRAGLRNG